MDQLISFALKEWPTMMSGLVFVLIIFGFLGLPFAVFFGLSKLLSKDRYILIQNGNTLFRLDTSTGKMHGGHGPGAFNEIQFLNEQWKSAKE